MHRLTAVLLTLLPYASVLLAQTIVLQAEDGTLNGVTASTTQSGYTGSGYVDGFDTDTDSVTVSFNIPASGLYDLSIAYSAPYGDKYGTILLNGVPSGQVPFTGTPWANASAGQVLLNAGTNSVGIQNNWGWYLIDAFYLTPSPPPSPHKANNPPVNLKATAEARSLLKYLQIHYANTSSFISGQQAGTYLSGDISTDAIAYIHANVGKTPAIAGFDFIDYSPSRVEYGTTSNNTEQAFAWDKRGGITAFVWHWNAPTDLLNTDAEPWWSGFYTAATTFNISSALAEGPNGTDYKLLLRDLDTIAIQLKRLQAAKIPVLFRFLHEAEGGWFWWGAQGPAAAKALYRLGYDRFTKYHKINNLIWVWNSVNPDWYPGDDVVDILAYDSYPSTGDHGPASTAFNSLVTLGKDKKVVALGEVGSIPDPSLLRAYYANWAYFVTWTGSFITDNTTNPLPFLKQIYADPHVVTLQTIGNFKHLLF